MWKRIGASVILVISLVYAPFLVTLGLFVCFLFMFDLYIEGVLLYMMADFAFSVPLERFHGSEIVLTMIGLLFFGISVFIKPYVMH